MMMIVVVVVVLIEKDKQKCDEAHGRCQRKVKTSRHE